MVEYRWQQFVRRAQGLESVEAVGPSEEMVDVASLPKSVTARANVIEMEAGEPRIRKGEVSVLVRPGQEVELRLLQHPKDLKVLSWRSFEIRCDSPRAKGAELILASYPYCTDWVEFDAMRRSGAKHHSRAELDEHKRRAIEEGMRESGGHIDYLRSLNFDLFETSSKFHTARLDRPERVEERIGTEHQLTGRKRWGSRLVKLSEFRKGSTYRRIEESWVLGLCREREACIDATRTDPRIAVLLEQGRQGTLFEEHFAGTPPYRSLQMEKAAARLAGEVLEASIEWSLAGPAEGLGGDPSWGGRFTELVERTYLRAMYALNKRVSDADSDVVPDLDVMAGAHDKSLAIVEERLGINAGEFDLDSQLEAVHRRLAEKDPERVIQGCILAAALRRAVSDIGELPTNRLEELCASSNADVSRAALWALACIRNWFEL